mmetsp:Transcript_5039/g.12919  ORF Transcript_5039/g.12919 Transcript_5039/m.12919 type:complete len:207 (+) Transcript_5039:59-679(+)
MEMDDGQAGYYNDLLHRVDTTLTQTRSAYGGEHAADDDEHRQMRTPNWFPTSVDFHAYALWGLPESRAAETSLRKKLLAATLASAALALSLELSRWSWGLSWFLATTIVFLVLAAARAIIDRVDRDDVVDVGLAAAAAAFALWVVVRLATLPGSRIAFAFGVYVAVLTIGFVLAEAVARIVVSKCDPELLRQSRPSEEDHLQYAAL